MRLNKIYASIKYEDLSEKDIEVLKSFGILNGYGGAGSNWLVRKLIWLILKKFDIAIANKHDYWYWLATSPRLECDEKFFQAMIQDMLNIYEDGGTKLWLVWNLTISLLAFYSIRIFWGKYYNK